MSAKGGRLEAQITVDAAWTATGTDGGGAHPVSIDTGTYFISDLCLEMQNQLSGAWTVEIDNGENGTGQVTIHSTDAPWSFTWGTMLLREVMGFATTGDVGPSSVPVTGSQTAYGIWIPTVPKWTPDGDDGPTYVAPVRQAVSGRGAVKTLTGRTRQVIDGLRWEAVPAARAKSHREAAAWSFESFWRFTQLGGLSQFKVGSPVRLYWDADASGYSEGSLIIPRSFRPARVVDNWPELYTVELPRLELGEA